MPNIYGSLYNRDGARNQIVPCSLKGTQPSSGTEIYNNYNYKTGDTLGVSGPFGASAVSSKTKAFSFSSSTAAYQVSMLYFNASKANALYGNSSTVTPKSRQCKFIIKY